MLDDLKYLHAKDTADALGLVGKQATQLRHLFADWETTARNNPISQVIYGGMGGSALAGDMVKNWARISVPFEIIRGYKLPNYAGDKTLCIIASHSGNTEEALSLLADAESRGAQIVIISSGGLLQRAAEEKGYPYLQLPAVVQPRYGVLHNFVALLEILARTGVTPTNYRDNLMQAADQLSPELDRWASTVPTANNPAKQLALELVGKTPVVYAGPQLAAAAYKWKISFNENAKNLAWWNTYPEFNHNEFIGWSSHPIDKPYAIIDLRSSFDDPQIAKRFILSDRLLSGRRPAAHVVEAKGNSPLAQLLWAASYGDFVSIYLGLLNGVDPAPVPLIEKLKKEL